MIRGERALVDAKCGWGRRNGLLLPVRNGWLGRTDCEGRLGPRELMRKGDGGSRRSRSFSLAGRKAPKAREHGRRHGRVLSVARSQKLEGRTLEVPIRRRSILRSQLFRMPSAGWRFQRAGTKDAGGSAPGHDGSDGPLAACPGGGRPAGACSGEVPTPGAQQPGEGCL